MMGSRNIFRFIALAIAVGALLSSSLLPTVSGAAITLTENEKTALAQKYSPVFYFNTGEEVYPVNVSYYLESCDLKELTSGGSVIVQSEPSASDLGSFNATDSQLFLDDRNGNIYDRGIISDYQNNMSKLGFTIYAHVFSSSTGYVVQYWMFYVLDTGVYNDHEGDWEMVQVSLDSSMTPIKATYSQHERGESASWGDVEKSGDHMISYVAKGSHANYFRYYQGKMGPAMDAVDNGGKVLRASDYSVVVLGERYPENHPSWQNWIDFSGRWGDWENNTKDIKGQNGPLGPVYLQNGSMWSDSSFSAGSSRLDTSILPLEFTIYYFALIMIVIALIPIIWVVVKFYRKRKRGLVKRPYLCVLEIEGKDPRSIANLLVIIALIISFIAAFLPFYEVNLSSTTGAFGSDGTARILWMSGIDGLQINTLSKDGSVFQISSIAIPFAFIILISILKTVTSFIACERSKIGKGYVTKGLGLFAPSFIALLVIASMSGLIASLFVPEGASPIRPIIEIVSANPLGGSRAMDAAQYGNATLTWGLGLGAWLMILAGCMMIAGGVLYIMGDRRAVNGPSSDLPAAVAETNADEPGSAPMGSQVTSPQTDETLTTLPGDLAGTECAQASKEEEGKASP